MRPSRASNGAAHRNSGTGRFNVGRNFYRGFVDIAHCAFDALLGPDPQYPLLNRNHAARNDRALLIHSGVGVEASRQTNFIYGRGSAWNWLPRGFSPDRPW